MLEEEEAAQLGLSATVDPAQVLFTTIVDSLERGHKVAVHCRQGIGRSGLVAAGVLITSGAVPERAVALVSAARGLPVPETPDQLRWVNQYGSTNSTLRNVSK